MSTNIIIRSAISKLLQVTSKDLFTFILTTYIQVVVPLLCNTLIVALHSKLDARSKVFLEGYSMYPLLKTYAEFTCLISHITISEYTYQQNRQR